MAGYTVATDAVWADTGRTIQVVVKGRPVPDGVPDDVIERWLAEGYITADGETAEPVQDPPAEPGADPADGTPPDEPDPAPKSKK